MAIDLWNLPFPLSWPQLGAAILCGGIIGFERQVRGKAAGIRTSILICLGTEVFVQLGVALSNEHVDPTRVIGQVITGIGFLGAGVILSQGGRLVGVTSATVVWVLAAIGSAIGLGYTVAAIVLAVVTVMILIGIEMLETCFSLLRRGAHDAHENGMSEAD